MNEGLRNAILKTGAVNKLEKFHSILRNEALRSRLQRHKVKRLPEYRMQDWTFEDRRTVEDIAAMVIMNGSPYQRQVYREGDAESGPFSIDYMGFRLGQLKVEVNGNGRMALIWPRPVKDQFGYGIYFHHYGLSRDGTVAGMFHARMPKFYVKAS